MILALLIILGQAVPLQPGQPAPHAGVLITAAMGERMKGARRDALVCKAARAADAAQCRIRLDFEDEQRRLEQRDHAAALLRLAKAATPPPTPVYARPAVVWPVALLLGGLAGWMVAR